MSRLPKHQHAPRCPYCGKDAALLDASAIYGAGIDAGLLWACRPCEAWVGCHKGTTRPKGGLAKKALRAARIRAHGAFDPIYRTGLMDRSEAYAWLADHVGVDRRDCHIGMFDERQCELVVIVSDWWRDGRQPTAKEG